jgi:hypothetical protein
VRGGYPTQPDLAEFDFFQWDNSGFGTNTVWPTFIDSANVFYYLNTNSYGVVELPTNIVMRVGMNYTATNETCVLTITTNGSAVVVPVYAYLSLMGDNFGDYHLDTFAVESYNDAQSGGSLLAHGTVGNIVLTVPAPPVASLQGALHNGAWQVQFAGVTNWNYLLQCSSNLQTWLPAGPLVNGTNGTMILQDLSNSPPLPPHQFYRVNAARAD